MLKSVLIILILSQIQFSCTKKQHSDHTFNAYIGPQPANYDWQKTQELIAVGVIYNVMEGLFSYDLNSAKVKIIPKLVETYKHEDNFKKWTFQLKQNIRWNDGVSLTAQNFVDAWERLLNQKTTSPHVQRFFAINGAQDYYLNKIKFSKVSIKSEGPLTLVVELNQAKPDFPSFLTGFFSFPIRKDLLDENGDFSKKSLLTTLGPYQFEELSVQSDKTCIKNSLNYYGSSPEQNRVCFLWLDDKTTAIRLFEKKELDFVKSPNYLEVTTKKLTPHFRSSETNGLYFLAFNLQKKPGNDIHFRRMIKKAVDRTELGKLAALDFTTTDSIYPLSIFDDSTKSTSEKITTQPLHLNAAVLLATNNTPFHTKILTYLAHKIEKELQHKTNIESVESKQYFHNLKLANKYDIFRISWTPAEVSPHGYAELFTSDSPMNYSGYKNKNYDLLVQKAQETVDTEKAKSLYREIEKIIVNQDVIAIPLFNHKQSFLIRNENFDLFPHPTERVDFVYLKKVKL